MRLFVFLLCLVSAIAWDPSPGLGFERWPEAATHQVGENYWLGWHVDQAPDVPEQERVVTLAFAVNTLGYVAFGISQNGGMKGADMVVIRRESGEFAATSMSSIDYMTPFADEIQPWKIIEWNQQNDESYFVVQRRAGGCTDNLVNLKFEDIEQRFIFSYGATQAFFYHGVTQRYSSQLNVYHDDPVIGVPDLPYFEMRMPGYEVPPLRDSFMCANMTFPISDKKFHIVAVEPVVTRPTAHHFVLWSCPNGVIIPDDATPEGAWECTTMAQRYCDILPIIWTQGQPLYTLGPTVGIPLGMGGAVNIVVQMHNNNPTFETGIRDTEGLRLYYTDDLRENDVGILIAGNGANRNAIILPPQQPSVKVISDCPEDCLADIEPVTVFSFHWHMHQTGKSATFHQIRDGKEILHLSMDYWDYNWQGYYEVEPFQLLPGDRIYSECEYDTMGRNETTYGGEGTQDEMCFFYISIYPAIRGFSCIGVQMPVENGPITTRCPNGRSDQFISQPFEAMDEADFCLI